MARKGGNPDLKPFTPEKARAAGKRSGEIRHKKASTFRAARAIIDSCAPNSIVNDKIADFWIKHGVNREDITPMMAEITPIYANAVAQSDMATLERVYKLLGISFESSREHNVKMSLENADDKPLKHDISGGLSITFEEVKPEPVEENEQEKV